MPNRIWLLAGACWLAFAIGANAQSSSSTKFSTGFTGVSPRDLTEQKIDTTKAIGYKPAESALETRFNFSALFNKLIVPTATKTKGVSNLPSPSSFPSYSNFKLPGSQLLSFNPFKSKSNPIQPQAPFIPSNNTIVGPGSAK